MQLHDQLTEAAGDQQEVPPENNEALTLMEIWQSRLNAILLDLVKITSQPTGKKWVDTFDFHFINIATRCDCKLVNIYLG